VVENHLSWFSMKKYFHEDSPFDDIFRGENLYDEAIYRFQNLPDKEISYFLNLQNHRRSYFLNILQEEKILTHNGNPTSEVLPSSNPKQHDFPKVKIKEFEETPET
jgi:hypothetical protein